jgi:hypothetical protein
MSRQVLTSFALGLLLVVAAALKVDQAIAEPPANRWQVVLLVSVELLIGYWLVFGLYPRFTWFLSVTWFISLAAISLYQIAVGASQCGCFGRLAVSPLFAFGLDLACVGALYSCSSSAYLPTVHSNPRRFVAYTFCTFISIAVATTLLLHAASALPIEISPPELAFGLMGRATSKEQHFMLVNSSSSDIRIATFDSSCDCLSLTLPRTPIAAGKAAHATARLDLAIEPVFVGRLSIVVNGKTDSGARAFSMRITATVR